MAGRGRGGGGGGRGRGRSSMSFNVEQLGFSFGEALPGPVLQPPPLYPLMENRSAPLESDPQVEYWLALKREYIEYLHDSPAYLLPVAAIADIERYSDRYQTLETSNNRGNGDMKYDVKRLPAELRPVVKKKRKRKASAITAKAPKAARKLEDINTRLEELEKHEEQDEEEGETGETKEDEKEGEGEEEVEEEEEMDEEMDDGTDYVNNYFDNGESYIDEEDDNLDDGPVY